MNLLLRANLERLFSSIRTTVQDPESRSSIGYQLIGDVFLSA
jgi:hypothetical protein